jgi:hypothetical protein
MIRAIRYFLGLCDHEWEDIMQKQLDVRWDDGSLSHVKIIFVSRCKKCKKIKKKIIRY